MSAIKKIENAGTDEGGWRNHWEISCRSGTPRIYSATTSSSVVQTPVAPLVYDRLRSSYLVHLGHGHTVELDTDNTRVVTAFNLYVA